MSQRYTITAALPYTNGPIHIGHLAGVYVPADIYSRYLRLTGNDVAFICGSDEHGVAISMKAKKEGITPQQVISKVLFRNLEFPLIISPVHLPPYTMTQHLIFLKNYMTMEISLKRLQNNYMMIKQDNS